MLVKMTGVSSKPSLESPSMTIIQHPLLWRLLEDDKQKGLTIPGHNQPIVEVVASVGTVIQFTTTPCYINHHLPKKHLWSISTVRAEPGKKLKEESFRLLRIEEHSQGQLNFYSMRDPHYHHHQEASSRLRSLT